MLFFHMILGGSAKGWECPTAFRDSPVLDLEPWQYLVVIRWFEAISQEHWFSEPNALWGAFVTLLRDEFTIEDGIKGVVGENRKRALEMALLHYVLADWPAHFKTLLQIILDILIVYKVRTPMSEALWDLERLHFPFSFVLTEKRSMDSFGLLNKTVNELRMSAYLWKLPRSQTLSSL